MPGSRHPNKLLTQYPTLKIILVKLQVFCTDVGSAVLKGLIKMVLLRARKAGKSAKHTVEQGKLGVKYILLSTAKIIPYSLQVVLSPKI